MIKPLRILLSLALIVVGLVLVGAALPWSTAGAAPAALPPRPTLTPLPTATPLPTETPTPQPTEPPVQETPAATAEPGQPTVAPEPTATAVLPTAGVGRPAWPWLLLGVGLLLLGVAGLLGAGARPHRR